MLWREFLVLLRRRIYLWRVKAPMKLLRRTYPSNCKSLGSKSILAGQTEVNNCKLHVTDFETQAWQSFCLQFREALHNFESICTGELHVRREAAYGCRPSNFSNQQLKTYLVSKLERTKLHPKCPHNWSYVETILQHLNTLQLYFTGRLIMWVILHCNVSPTERYSYE